jgi:hypothetical protein
LKVFELVGDTESVTVDGAVVITTAQTASSSYEKEAQLAFYHMKEDGTMSDLRCQRLLVLARGLGFQPWSSADETT